MANTPTSKSSTMHSRVPKRTTKRYGSGASGGSSMPSVQLGLHGLGEVLSAIKNNGLQGKFVHEMGTDNLSVSVHSETAQKIANFMSTHFSDKHPMLVQLNRDNCDPATDPWCINI